MRATTVGARWAVVLAAMLGATEAMAQRPRLPFPIRGASAEPTPAEREYTAGEVLLRAGDLPGAEARFVAARGLDPRDARPVFYLGEVARAHPGTPGAASPARSSTRATSPSRCRPALCPSPCSASAARV